MENDIKEPKITKNKEKTILTVLVGSRAHGLHNENSDYDYRGVYILPTELHLGIYPMKDNCIWIEGKEDNTAWEVGKFLFLATKCNPTILEVFKAPIKDSTDEGEALRKQFSRVWNSTDVRNAFIGYGLNQRKKFLERKDSRPDKYATAYLRTLVQAYYLLTFNELIINMGDTEEFETLKRFKNGEYEIGEVMQKTYDWENRVREAFEHNPDKKTDIEQLNTFLVKLRKRNF